MILPVCLGILLVGIIMTPSAFAIFPDPEEDPRHYLVRYYTEPSYQAWFDKNYPNDTIEDKVGYSKKIVTDDYYVNSLFGFANKPPANWFYEENAYAMGGESASSVIFSSPREHDLTAGNYGSSFNIWYEHIDVSEIYYDDLVYYFSDQPKDDDQTQLKINDQSVQSLSDGIYKIRYDFSDISVIPEFIVDDKVYPKMNLALKNSIVIFLYPNGDWYLLYFSAMPENYDTDVIEFNNSIDTFYVGETEKLSDLLEDYAPKLKTAAAEPSGGCGPGTVLKGNTCVLAPQESNDGCGAGTKMVNGVCQLDKSSGSSIPPLYIAGGAAAIGAAIIGIVFAVRRGSGGTSAPKPARQDLDDYEEQYLRRQGQRPSRKPAETRQTSSSCNSCGKPLKPTAKFCGKCGSKQ